MSILGERVTVPATNTAKRLRCMRVGVLHSAKIIVDDLQSAGLRYRSALVTLTYRDGALWDSRDISRLLSHYRKWAKRHGCWVRYVWVLELTKSGRPHYHIVLFLPRGVTPPLPDKQGWWRKGMSNAKWARSPVGYIAKYASKGASTSHPLPRNARLWGCSALGLKGRSLLRWHLAPSWLRLIVPFADGVRRFHSWWVNVSTGWGYLSPWVYDGISGGEIALRYVGFSTSSVFIPLAPFDSPPWPVLD